MTWEARWRELANRIDVWSVTVDRTMRMLEVAPQLREKANRALAPEAHDIHRSILELELPAKLEEEIANTRRRLDSIEAVVDGERVINARWIVLAALRIPLDKAAQSNEGPRVRLVERAFVHLKRMLAVDDDLRKRWQSALAAGETRCEQLGGLHLLSHGIYGFKADAGSGRTDLILGDRLMVNDEVRAAEAMVLTEWKVARDGELPETKCKEARAQAEQYAAGELGGFELRRHRYLVIVSARQLAMLPPEIDGDVTYHYVNIAVDPLKPSAHSRRVSKATGR